MTTEEIQALEMPKYVEEIKGTKEEQLKTKAALISKFGYAAWEKMIASSSRFTKR